MNIRRRALYLGGSVVVSIGAALLAPLVVMATARPPLAELATWLGSLLFRYLPWGPVVDSSTQSAGGPEYFFLPAVRWVLDDDFLRWIAQGAGHLVACAFALWLWGWLGFPARLRGPEASALLPRTLFRTVLIGAAWGLGVSVALAQIRIILTTWHNATLGSTWQIYHGFIYTTSREERTQELAAAALYPLGVLWIARREAWTSLRTVLDKLPQEKCPVCDYPISNASVCPECGTPTDGSVAKHLYLTRAHARAARTWWWLAVKMLLALSVLAGLLAPLTEGLIWYARTTLGF